MNEFEDFSWNNNREERCNCCQRNWKRPDCNNSWNNNWSRCQNNFPRPMNMQTRNDFDQNFDDFDDEF